jgi:TP901 family phage tail tape measure protein
MALNTEVIVTASTRGAEQQIQQLTNKNYAIKLNVDSQPLGRITGQLSEFNKSMDAANARVVAFGASAGAIAVLEKTFHALIDSTIEVQKALNGIQVILNASDSVMGKFGKNLFDIAKNTGQSFDVVAEAATNLSRQGLGVEETLKRTNDALILSRLTGMGAAESVRSLTAAVNSFASQAVTATEIVNKFATVDSSFAIGAKDLPEAISRVGSAAAQAGVSLDELIALVTSAQVATARGGSVIGNSFKTIFTRLERGKTQDLLESLGVSTKDSEGKLKSTIDMLKDLARVYGTLSQGQQANVAEKVGGVFQINILKAALADLSKEHSVYNAALQVSENSTDEATKRNEKLNETYAAQINRLQQGATQLAASAGKQVFGPSMDRIIGAGNGILDSLNNVDSSSIGAKLGKGILDGIGQILAGPGLVMIGGVIIKLLGDFSKFAGGSVKELLGLNGASKEQAAIQASITKLLEKNPSLLAQINTEARTQNDQAKILLDFYTKQTAQMELQARLTAEIASKLYTGGVRMGSEGVPVKRKAEGYIPEFASEEAQARMLGAKNPRAMWSSGTIGGQKFIKNSEETEIVGFGSNGDSAVIPRYADGYIPNFAKKSTTVNAAGVAELLVPNINGRTPTTSVGKNNRNIIVEDINVRTFKPNAINEEARKDAGEIVNVIADAVFPTFASYINHLSPLGNPPVKSQDIKEAFQQGGGIKGAYGALQAFAGSAFEVGITKAIGYHAKESESHQGDFDVRGGELGLLKKLFGLTTSLGDFKISDSKGNLLNFSDKVIKELGGADYLLGKTDEKAKGRRGSAVKKVPIPSGVPSTLRGRADGYIPNFADALHDSIAREISAGAPANEIYVKKYGQLANENNPDGYGVFNKRDEGDMSKEMRAMRKKGYAAGYIPNFADDGSGTGSGGLVSGGASALIDFAFAMSILKNNSKEATEATRQKAEALAKEKEAQIQSQQAIIKTKEAFIDANKGIQGMAGAVMNASRDIGFANQKITELSRLSLGQKVGQIKDSITSSGAYQGANKFLSGRGGTALTFAPLIAGQISQLIPQNSQGGRGAAQAVSSLGNMASYAGAGAMLGGPVGAGVGLAAGAILELPKVIESFTTKLPDLQQKADKDKDKYNQLDAQSKAYLSASSNYDDALKSGNATPEQLKRLSEAKQSAFQQYSPEQQIKLLEAREKGGSEGEYAQAGTLSREAGEQALSSQRALKQQTFLEKDKRDITFGSEAAKDTAGALISQITSGKTGMQGLESLKGVDLNELKAKSGESQYDTANRLKGTLTKSFGGANISKENEKFVEDIGNKLATGNSQAAAATMEELAKQISKMKEAAEKGAAADQKAAEQAAEAAAKRMAEAEAIKQNGSAIEKQIGLLQQATAMHEKRAGFNMERSQNARAFSTEMAQTRRSNMEEVIDSIAGKSPAGTRAEFANKSRAIDENARNKETDIIEKTKLNAGNSVDSLFMKVYDMDKKKSSAAPDETQAQGDNIKPLMTNPFKNVTTSQYGTQEERNGYIQSLGANEIRRQTETSQNVQNAYEQYAKSGGTNQDQEKFRSALEKEFGKIIDSSQKDSQELKNLVAENVQKGEDARHELVKVRESAAQEQQRTTAELTKMLLIMGAQASLKTFGGGMTALEGNRITSTPELSGLISVGKSAQKFKDDQQRKINSGLELSSADVGNRNIAENYMKVNRVLREKYQGGMPTGENIGSSGPGGAEEMMEQEIKKAMQKDLEETRKSFKGAPKELQVMNTKAENAMIANATGVNVKDVEQYSGKKRDEEMGKALENIAKLKVAQETGDRTRLGDKDSFLRKAFDKGPAHQEELNKYYRDEGNKAEQEAAETLKQIYEVLGGEGKGAKTDLSKNVAAAEVLGGEGKGAKTDLSKNIAATEAAVGKSLDQTGKSDNWKTNDDTEWRKGQEAKEREMDRQSRIRKVTESLSRRGGAARGNEANEEKELIPYLKSGYAGIATRRVNKEMAKEEMQKRKQQEKEAAGGKGGGGNVTVAAPQISININGANNQTKEQINQKMPEFNAEVHQSITQIATKVFQLQDRVDRMSLGGNGANIPVTQPASKPQ